MQSSNPTAPLSSSGSRQQPQITFLVHHSPTDFLSIAQPWLAAQERRANIILPHAEKLKKQEQSGSLAPGQFWITAWSPSSSSASSSSAPARRGPHLDFALSCTEGNLGTYPLFLFSTHEVSTLPEQWLDSCMNQLAQQLATTVDAARVFSIFGQERAIQLLCLHWSKLTGFRPVPQPYYEASSSYCTPATFVPSRSAAEAGHVLRKAVDADLEAVARLCQEFAEDSPPFTLTLERARQEASYLIRTGIVWVYTIDGQLSTIVAVTRSSTKVAAITKVYTTPSFRRRGCADRLVAHVCEEQFKSGKDSVVLYVGHALSAARVYMRVGFVGVGLPKDQPAIQDANVERWLELGFEGTRIGHW